MTNDECKSIITGEGFMLRSMCLLKRCPIEFCSVLFVVLCFTFQSGSWPSPRELDLLGVGTGVKGQNTKCLRGVRKASRMIDYERKESKLKW